MEVYVTSGTPEKIKKSIELGATGGVNYKDIDAFEQLKKMAGGFDVVIDSASDPIFISL
jgi:NADPH:quinone reductase-like Zn-dependent oxidoreductase